MNLGVAFLALAAVIAVIFSTYSFPVMVTVGIQAGPVRVNDAGPAVVDEYPITDVTVFGS